MKEEDYLDTAIWPLTLKVPYQTTFPPALVMRSFSSSRSGCWIWHTMRTSSSSPSFKMIYTYKHSITMSTKKRIYTFLVMSTTENGFAVPCCCFLVSWLFKVDNETLPTPAVVTTPVDKSIITPNAVVPHLMAPLLARSLNSLSVLMNAIFIASDTSRFVWWRYHQLVSIK